MTLARFEAVLVVLIFISLMSRTISLQMFRKSVGLKPLSSVMFRQPYSTMNWQNWSYRVSRSKVKVLKVFCVDNAREFSLSSGDQKNKPPVVGKKSRKVKIAPVSISTLNEAMAREELVRLNEEINSHDELYYGDASESIISDAAYDKLVRRAEDIEGKFESLSGIVEKLSRVGYARNQKLGSFHHSQSMLSLDNAFNVEEIEKFANRASEKLSQSKLMYVVEPKIDGLSLALHYNSDGILIGAGTRGNGQIGEDVTMNVEFVKDVPREIDMGLKTLNGQRISSVEVRGEVYISKKDFIDMNNLRTEQNATAFSTARNAAAGSLRQLDPNTLKGRNLRFFAYSLVLSTAADKLTSIDQNETIQHLNDYGFRTASPFIVCESLEEVSNACMQMEAKRGELEYDVDGAVIKINSVDQQKLLGHLTRYPNWAIAYKFKAEEVETTLLNIEVLVGRTGVLTPVAILTPVMIGGVQIERATLHNEAEISRLGLTVGSKVRLKRSGDVIPKITGVVGQVELDETKRFLFPSHCPVCGSVTERDLNGVLVRCTGTFTCSAQAIERINHFCSRDAADIDGFGPSKIEELYNAGIINNIADVYKLRATDLLESSESSRNEDGENNTESEDRAEQEQNQETQGLRGRKGWGDRSVNNLLSAIDSTRNLTFSKFLFALGIRHVGQESARLIANEFQDFAVLWDYLQEQATALGEFESSSGTLEIDALLHLSEKHIAKQSKQSKQSKEKENKQTDPTPTNVENVENVENTYIGTRLFKIPGIGPKAVRTLIELATNDNSTKIMKDLLEEISIGPDTDFVADSENISEFSANNFVFTGKFEEMTRAEATELCRKYGANVSSSVSRDTTFVVFGGDRETSSKLEKASKLGIDVITEAEFQEMIKVTTIV